MATKTEIYGLNKIGLRDKVRDVFIQLYNENWDTLEHIVNRHENDSNCHVAKDGTLQVGLNADMLDGIHLDGLALAGHNHDNRYYTRGEADAIFARIGDCYTKEESDARYIHVEAGLITEDTVITVDDTKVPDSDSGLLKDVIDWLANRLKAFSGEELWRTNPATSLKQLLEKLLSHKHTGENGDADKINPFTGLTYVPVNRAGDYMEGDLTVPNLVVAQRVIPSIGNDNYHGIGFPIGENGSSNNAYIRCFNDQENKSKLVIHMNKNAADEIAIESAGSIKLSAPNVTIDEHVIWNAGNDGSESGLHADLLDGRHGADYALVNHIHPIATAQSNGFISSTDQSKLNSVQFGAEVNQNAFSNIRVGETIISADGKSDTLELVPGDNIAIQPDFFGDRVVIALTSPVPDSDRAGGYTPGNNAGNLAVSNGSVCERLNADLLDGKHYVLVTQGVVSVTPNFTVYLNLKYAQNHRFYNYSVYADGIDITYGIPPADLEVSAYAYLIKSGSPTDYDHLAFRNNSTSPVVFNYSVYSWE